MPQFSDYSSSAATPIPFKGSGLKPSGLDKTKGECRLVLLGGGSSLQVCGLIGKGGTTICTKPGCTVPFHKENLKRFGPVSDGLYIQTEEHKVLALPHADMQAVSGSKMLETMLGMAMSKNMAHLVIKTLRVAEDCRVDKDQELQSAINIYTGGSDSGLDTPVKQLSDKLKYSGETLSDEGVVDSIRKTQLEAAINLRLLNAKMGDETNESTGPLIPMVEGFAAQIEECAFDCKKLTQDLDAANVSTKRKLDHLGAQTAHLGGRISSVEGAVGTIQDEMESVHVSVGTCLTKLVEVNTYLTNQGLGSLGGNGQGVNAQEVEDILKVHLLEGTGVINLNGGQFVFAGFGEVKKLAHGTPEGAWGALAICPFYVLARTANLLEVSIESLQQQQIHQVKTGYSRQQTVAITSWQSPYPGIFTTTSSSTVTHTATSTVVSYPRIKSYEHFNREDNRHGVATFIRSKIFDVQKQLRLEVQLAFKNHPEVMEVVLYLLDQSVLFIKTLLSFMEDKRRELLINCHGPGPHTAQQKKAVWDLMLLILTVICDLLWVHRGEATQAFEDPETATAKYLYTGMKAHMEMEKLMNLGFAEHPEILPKLFHHIFEAFVSRSDHEALQDAFDKLKAEFKDLKSLVDRFLSVMNDGGNGGGGAGGGGVVKKKQRRGKGAAKEAEENAED